jgi:hypothetical protein
MPKDLTKLSLKEFEAVSGGEFDKRARWSKGTLELTVYQAVNRESDEDDADFNE